MSPEREGAAVALALLIMRDGPDFPVPWEQTIAGIKAEFGMAGLQAIKKRAWRHVKANREGAGT